METKPDDACVPRLSLCEGEEQSGVSGNATAGNELVWSSGDGESAETVMEDRLVWSKGSGGRSAVEIDGLDGI